MPLPDTGIHHVTPSPSAANPPVVALRSMAGPGVKAGRHAIRGQRAAPGRHGIDGPLAALIAGVAVLLAAFMKIAEEVTEGETHHIDTAILLALRMPGDPSQPLGPPWLQEMIRDFTALGSTGVLTVVTLAAAGFLASSGRRRLAGFVLAAVVGGVVLSSALKLGFARPRPDLFPVTVPVFTDSFPSGHAMMSAVVYLTLGNLLARTQTGIAGRIYPVVLALCLALLVGISRIWLGVHWPSDVLAGWAAGACWALACRLVMARLQRGGWL